MSNEISNMFKLNPFAPKFSEFRSKDEIVNRLMSVKNSQGQSVEETEERSGYGFFGDTHANYIDFFPILENKRARVLKYREMSLYPEIADAIENIVNDAIVDNGENKILTLQLNKKVPEALKKRIYSAFDYFINTILNFIEKGDELFKKWLIEGEIYGELVLNDSGTDLINIKILPSFTMTPIYKSGLLVGFIQRPDISCRSVNSKDAQITFEPNQIAYSNYGLTFENEYDVRGYLESAVKTYNQLKSLEDSIIIYRLVRAPERRVWNIYTGRMPKGKAEEFVKGVMKRYKTKNLYDPNSGAIDTVQNIQTMSHDIWFSKDDSGNGTTVDTIGGGMQLGEINDLDWFKEKLYKALRIPTSRWIIDQKQGPYSSGKMGEITREEIKFARFIEKLQRKFKSFITYPFLTLLRIRQIPEEYLDINDFDIRFEKSNLFKEYKEIELREARLGTLSSIAGYICSRDNLTQPEALFSKEFVLKNYFKMSNDEYELNKKLIEKEMLEYQEMMIKYPPINPYEQPQVDTTQSTNIDQQNPDQNVDQNANVDTQTDQQNNSVDNVENIKK